MENIEIALKESKRIYYFPSNEKIILNDITALKVSASGNHRLKTADKKLHIIPTGWLHIEIYEAEWTI